MWHITCGMSDIVWHMTYHMADIVWHMTYHMAHYGIWNVTHHMWHLTHHVTLHVTHDISYKTWDIICGLSCDTLCDTCNMPCHKWHHIWHLTLHVIHDISYEMWHITWYVRLCVTYDTSYDTCYEMWHITYGMWHVECDTWHTIFYQCVMWCQVTWFVMSHMMDRVSHGMSYVKLCDICHMMCQLIKCHIIRHVSRVMRCVTEAATCHPK